MDWSSFVTGVVPAHSLPTGEHILEAKRGLGYNERPTTGTALLAICMAYIVMLVAVQGKSPALPLHCEWSVD